MFWVFDGNGERKKYQKLDSIYESCLKKDHQNKIVNVAVVKHSGIYNFFIFKLTKSYLAIYIQRESTQKSTTIRYAVNLMQNRFFKEDNN